MQLLGDLIRLPKDKLSLPLPWWQRAPLGFLNGTNVYVGLVQSERPIGDIVVSALDINKWDNILRLECRHDDEPGVIATLMEAVLPLNVALAETVTTETGKEHHATLFCEDKGMEKVKDAIPRIQESLKAKKFRDINLDPFLSPIRLPILESCQAEIQHGWLRGIDFAKWIEKHHGESSRQLIDLSRAVVSADSENRILRYVFPYNGTKTIKISHRDIPGALRAIFQTFATCELNVLSALLRRGGQKAGYAELLAVCEPRGKADAIVEVYQQLRSEIYSIDQKYDPNLYIEDGIVAERVIYLLPPHLRRHYAKQPVFISTHHLNQQEHDSTIKRQVLSVLQEFDCWSLEIPPEVNSNAERQSQLATLMERVNASIVLVTGTTQQSDGQAISQLFQRLGFLQAYNKPLLLLTESELEIFNHWCRNRQDSWAKFVLDDNVLDTNHPASINSLVGNWLRKIRQEGMW